MIVTHYIHSGVDTELRKRVRNMSRTELECAYQVLAMELMARSKIESSRDYYKYVVLLDQLDTIYKPWYNWWPCRLSRFLSKKKSRSPNHSSKLHQ